MSVSRVIPLLLLLTCAARSQPRQFEVAAIKPNQSGADSGTSFNLFEGGRLKITNEPAKLLIRLAYRLQNAQIVSGPPWLETDRFDIDAKTGSTERIKPDQVSPLMRNLLADRFNLKSHRDTREL